MSGTLAIGQIIGGRYQVVRYIDEGGMQFVYEAYDSLMERVVALKTPKNRSSTKRFRRSAIVAARVNHPSVAKTLDYVRDGDERFLIEELVEGEDLSKALLRRTPFLDPYLAARVFHHLAKGVAAAHHAGVIHRDLKPSNVMVVGDYSLEAVKVTDFGIAKLAQEEIDEAVAGGDTSLSMSQTAVGALPYMAPEAIDSPELVSYPADIWSIGAMIFHLLTGSTPYGTGLRAVKSILAAEIPPVPTFLSRNPQFSALSKNVLDLALKCMQKDPLARPSADQLVQSCGDLYYNSSPRAVGVVKRVDYNKYGFIRTDGEDVFFHVDSCYGPELPQAGDEVLFSSYEGGGAYRAYPVVKLSSTNGA
ncbi:protein kinase [Stenotrophomonas sp.]|uniref:protein kinase domain-containing protein n=1 Tax=Stenotrophomonas sp. TaxID=69392 RepID=UPI0028A71312|nr:protein kinase [Stenotrophomonas sp.]